MKFKKKIKTGKKDTSERLVQMTREQMKLRLKRIRERGK